MPNKIPLVELIKRAENVHGVGRYDYSLITEENYKNTHTDVNIKCNECGDIFPQTPHSHLNYSGCPYCKRSHGEEKLANILKSKDINFIPQYKFNDCRDKNPLPFDFYLPNYNICIEYDGRQHFEEVGTFGGKKQLINQQKHDTIKTNYYKQNNIPLLRIRFDEDIETRLNQFLSDKLSIEPQSIFDL